MTPVERVARILAEAVELNREIRDAGGDLDLRDVRAVIAGCREAEGWLRGVRDVLLDRNRR